MATRTTTQAGNWSAVGTWVDNLKPGAGDDAVINHNVTVDENIAFATLDNNAILTFDATARIVTIDDGGNIDNADGTIDHATNNGNVTYKASVGVTKWTWQINSGTFNDGNGVKTFENGVISINNTYSGFDSGTYNFSEDMSFLCTAGTDRNLGFGINTIINFSAGKTFTISNGINRFYLVFKGTTNAIGSFGNEITFDGNGKLGVPSIQLADASAVFIFRYCNFTDCYRGIYISHPDLTKITIENCNLYSNSIGLYLASLGSSNTLTINTSKVYNNSSTGMHLAMPTIITDCEIYSNTGYNISIIGTSSNLVIKRSKIYNSSNWGVVWGDQFHTGINKVENCLIYEHSGVGVYMERTVTGDIINSTLVNNVDGTYGNLLLAVQGVGDTVNVKNCIIGGGKYGIDIYNDTGTINITYNNVYGASSANYDGIADPTGSDGNISVDPLFVDADNDDYSIKATSPCIGVGTDIDAPDDDIDGETRPMPTGTITDIGAYEEQTTDRDTWTTKIFAWA